MLNSNDNTYINIIHRDTAFEIGNSATSMHDARNHNYLVISGFLIHTRFGHIHEVSRAILIIFAHNLLKVFKHSRA